MQLDFVCLCFLILVAMWRKVSHRGKHVGEVPTGDRVQDFLQEKCPEQIAGLLQWYGLLFVGVCLLMVQTYYTHLLLLWSFWFTTAMPTYVRRISKASLVAGVLGFILLVAHFIHDAFAGKEWREKKGQPYPWALSKRQDMLFCLLSVPAIYIPMSVQSTARMWMVISGAYGEYGKDVDLELYQENLDLCSVCGYWGVYVFSRLCWKFIQERASTDTRHIVKFAGFQGVSAFVFVGVVKSVLSFGIAYATRHVSGFTEQHGDLLEACYAKISDALVVVTILCIYNMILICNFDSIQDALGNATAKFLGLRALLFLQQVQPVVLNNSVVMGYLDLNENTGKLLHSSLLTLECVLIIIFNFLSWEYGVRKELLYDARSLAQRREDGSGYTTELGDGDWLLAWLRSLATATQRLLAWPRSLAKQRSLAQRNAAEPGYDDMLQPLNNA